MAERNGIFWCAASTEKLGAVGFELSRAGYGGRLGNQEMCGPDRLFVWSAEATMGKESFATRKPFSFDEELVKSGMRAICPVRRESELEISGQFKTARFA